MFDSDTVDLFSLQNEITNALANALGVELIAAEAARPTEHPDALDYILRGRAALLKPWTPDTYREAINLFEHASALDPQSVEAQGRLSIALTGRVLDGMSNAPAVDITRAEGLVGRALAVSPRSSLAHFAKGHMLLAQERYDEAILEYETVLVFNRNWLGAISHLGLCKFFTGSIEEAIPLLEQAIRVSPRDPSIGNWYFFIGTAHLVQSQVDDAITWAKKARSANPGHPRRYALLASAYALKGQTARAAAELAKARRLSGDNRYSSIASLKVGLQLSVPEVRALFETTLFRRSPQGRNARGMTTTRRLAAILAADVAGYSRLIGADEGGTLRQLKAIRDELIDPMLAAHHGRLVETTGDGLLVEFSSIVDAPI